MLVSPLQVDLRHHRLHFSFLSSLFLKFPQKSEAKHVLFVFCTLYRKNRKKKRKEKHKMPGITSPNSSLTFVALEMAEQRSRGWKMFFASRRLISLPQTTINSGSLWLISRGQRENKWQMGSGGWGTYPVPVPLQRLLHSDGSFRCQWHSDRRTARGLVLVLWFIQAKKKNI